MIKYIAVDQYGEYVPIEEHPRKELMEHVGIKHADNMYTDLTNGGYRHIGYIVGGRWFRVLGIEGNAFAPPGGARDYNVPK